MEYWVAGLWVLITGVVIRLWLWFSRINCSDKKKKKGIPKGSLGWPVIGETLDFISCGYSSRPVSFMVKRTSLYGKVFKTNIIGTPIIVSTDAEVNKVVLLNHGNTFVPAYPKSIEELLGRDSILRINGPLHKKLHTLFGAFFRSPLLKDRITRDIESSVDLALASWAQLPFVYVQDAVKKITFEVLVKTLMSIGPGEDMDVLKRDFEEFIKGLICLPIKFPGTRLYKSLKAKERLVKTVKRIVEERRRMATERQKSSMAPAPENDAVDLLLRNYEKQSDPSDFISGKIVEMMIPGEETMPTAMTLAVKFLSDNPVVLAKLVEENMELKRKKLESGEGYSWSDYISLSFTHNVINETLRMANIINGVWRKALKDVEIKGYMIPEGWCVLASFISVHMDEDIYENPFQFDPWRWDRMNGTAGNSSICFTPFGGGQRLCPGLDLSKLEISIFLHRLVTKYRWKAEEDEIVSFPTVKLKRKLPIRIVSIDSDTMIYD